MGWRWFSWDMRPRQSMGHSDTLLSVSSGLTSIGLLIPYSSQRPTTTWAPGPCLLWFLRLCLSVVAQSQSEEKAPVSLWPACVFLTSISFRLILSWKKTFGVNNRVPSMKTGHIIWVQNKHPLWTILEFVHFIPRWGKPFLPLPIFRPPLLWHVGCGCTLFSLRLPTALKWIRWFHNPTGFSLKMDF